MIFLNVLAAGLLLHGGIQDSPQDMFRAKLTEYGPCLIYMELVDQMLKAKTLAHRKGLWMQFKIEYGFYGSLTRKQIKDIEKTGIESGFLPEK